MPNAVRRGLELGCEAIQVFTRNQRQWTPPPLDPGDVEEYCRLAREAGYAKRTVSHASYLINLCATDPEILRKSRTAFVDELERCAALEIPYLCVHPGSHVGSGEEAGLALIAESVRGALEGTGGVQVLLENTAGQGTNLGWRLEQLGELIRRIGNDRVGVCIDTCHLFAAGYDLRSPGAYEETMGVVEEAVGLDRIRAFHLNDSRFECGSRRDRHADIGAGEIGRAAFRRLVNDERFSRLPGLLETPKEDDGDRRNLDLLRKMRTA